MTASRLLDISSIIVICLAFVLILFIPTAGAEISYTFDIDTQGSAWYIIEYRTLLDSQDRINEFDEFKLVVEGNSTHKAEFEARMRVIVTQAGIATSRPMIASDFDVSATTQNTATGNYGIVRYSFMWGNFAEVSGSSVVIGDVFFGGQYISTGDTFIIKVPDGYRVSEVTPTPDSERKSELIWSGPRNFNSGEPAVVIKKSSSLFIFVVLILLVLLVLGAGVILNYRKKAGGQEPAPRVRSPKVEDMEPEPKSELKPELKPEPDDSGLPEPVKPPVSTVTRFESDDEIIISMLRQHGDAMMQTEIVKQSGFSKSKTSALLTNMAENRQIERVKKGRENLIRLI
ncbi:MAG: hypothetical protein GQ533_09045 [Methanosarcinaceae archaeon]|nr:hypothetical protein [Methanosarcinaceae archaeon]